MKYKASPALTRESPAVLEFCKDISAFANSAGGQIVYGIEEDRKTGKPRKVDSGVTDAKITPDLVEQILNSKIQPRLNGVRITRIRLEKGFGYVISVPQSRTGPHQAPDLKYYKRFGRQSVAMYDYEIKDIMRRGTVPELSARLHFRDADSVKLDFPPSQEFSEMFSLCCTIENRSPQPAFHIINDVSIDASFINPFQTGRFRVWSVSSGPPEMRTFRRTIASPPDLPVFREGTKEATLDQIALQFPSSLLSGER